MERLKEQREELKAEGKYGIESNNATISSLQNEDDISLDKSSAEDTLKVEKKILNFDSPIEE